MDLLTVARETIMVAPAKRPRISFPRGYPIASTKAAAGAGASGGVGDVAWAGPGNILASDDSRAAAILVNPTDTSEILTADQFDFSGVPAGSVPVGVLVGFEAQVSHADVDVALLKIVNQAGSQIGNTRHLQLDTLFAVGADADAEVGGATFEPWGAAVAAMALTDWQNANTGVAISVVNNHSGVATCLIDCCWMTLFYETP